MNTTAPEATEAVAERPERAPPRRLASLDAYRGLVMFLLMAELLSFCDVAKAIPASKFWKFLCHHQSHVSWIGCSLHDLIQPSFRFSWESRFLFPWQAAGRAASHGPEWRPTRPHAR